MSKGYDIRVKKKRKAWEIYKALRKDNIYKSSNLCTKAYTKAKQILIYFHKDYTFNGSNLTDLDVERSINMLADMEISSGKVKELTDNFIGEFLENL